MSKRRRAEDLNHRAGELQGRGELEEAIAVYQQAAAADPRWAAPLYNLGLLYKYASRWEESLDCNQQATDRDRENTAAWWNLGIAATALGRWDLARSAWRACEVPVPDGTGPLDFPCGFSPIRPHPDGDAEIVWAHRIDPARAILANIPFPESGHRWRDQVLNDGAPVGYRRYEGREVPVFNALALLVPSPFGTFVARVAMPPERQHLVRLA